MTKRAPPAIIRPVREEDRAAWLDMRNQLWPDSRMDSPAEIEGMWADGSGRVLVLVAERPGRSELCGFLELSLREHVDGCATSPVVYLEGWWVEAAFRRRGVGTRLVAAAESWAESLGLSELASDSEIANDLGFRAHMGLGFQEVGRVVQYRKRLGSDSPA